MLKLKFQYFGHLMWRVDSLEKTLMLGEIGGRRRRGDRGWDGWMASPTQWTWVWVNSGSWWWTGRPGVMQFMGSQRVGHDWATELNWTELKQSLSQPGQEVKCFEGNKDHMARGRHLSSLWCQQHRLWWNSRSELRWLQSLIEPKETLVRMWRLELTQTGGQNQTLRKILQALRNPKHSLPGKYKVSIRPWITTSLVSGRQDSQNAYIL